MDFERTSPNLACRQSMWELNDIGFILFYFTNDEAVCKIIKNSGMGEVFKSCELIVWDECTMAHKKVLEAY